MRCRGDGLRAPERGDRSPSHVKSAEAATLVATAELDVHGVPRPAGFLPGEGRQVTVVVPMHKVVVPRAGRYLLQVDIDAELAGDLTFTVVVR